MPMCENPATSKLIQRSAAIALSTGQSSLDLGGLLPAKASRTDNAVDPLIITGLSLPGKKAWATLSPANRRIMLTASRLISSLWFAQMNFDTIAVSFASPQSIMALKNLDVLSKGV